MLCDVSDKRLLHNIVTVYNMIVGRIMSIWRTDWLQVLARTVQAAKLHLQVIIDKCLWRFFLATSLFPIWFLFCFVVIDVFMSQTSWVSPREQQLCWYKTVTSLGFLPRFLSHIMLLLFLRFNCKRFCLCGLNALQRKKVKVEVRFEYPTIIIIIILYYIIICIGKVLEYVVVNL